MASDSAASSLSRWEIDQVSEMGVRDAQRGAGNSERR